MKLQFIRLFFKTLLCYLGFFCALSSANQNWDDLGPDKLGWQAFVNFSSVKMIDNHTVRFWVKKKKIKTKKSNKNWYDELVIYVENDCAEDKYRFLQVIEKRNSLVIKTYSDSPWEFGEPDSWFTKLGKLFCSQTQNSN